MPFFAVLDACVLYPFSLRDTLLRFAEAEFYAPLWSDEILDEMQRNVIAAGASTMSMARTRELMTTAFDGACVPADAIAAIEGSMTNSAKDRHVLAAAVCSNAEVLVTANLKDFPAHATQPHQIAVQHPDEFLEHLFNLDSRVAARIIRQQAADQIKPPLSVKDLLVMLTNAGVPRFAALVREELQQQGSTPDL